MPEGSGREPFSRSADSMRAAQEALHASGAPHDFPDEANQRQPDRASEAKRPVFAGRIATEAAIRDALMATLSPRYKGIGS